MVPRRRREGRSGAHRGARARRWPTSTCCACRKSRTTFPIPGSPAAAAKISSPRSRSCCPISRRCPARSSTFPATTAQRRHFGNLILSRLPVGQVFRHLLPYPVDPGVNGHAADRARSRRARAVRRRAHHHDASRVLRQRSSGPRRSRPCARSTPKAADMRGWARSSKRAAGRSTITRALPRRSSPATSTSSRTIRCMRE